MNLLERLEKLEYMYFADGEFYPCEGYLLTAIDTETNKEERIVSATYDKDNTISVELTNGEEQTEVNKINVYQRLIY